MIIIIINFQINLLNMKGSVMNLDPYIYKRTFLHVINTKIKTILYLIYMILSSITENIYFSTILLLTSILLLFFLEVKPYKLIHRVKYPIFLLSLIILSTAIFSIDTYNNYENLKNVIKISYVLFSRSLASLFFTISYFSTTKLIFLTNVLIKFHIPNMIIQIFIFGYRFIYILIDELNKLIKSSTIKGFKFCIKLRNLIVLSNMIGILFIKSYEKSNLLFNTMLSRGYNEKINIINNEKLTDIDYKFLLLSLLYTIIVFYISYFIWR